MKKNLWVTLEKELKIKQWVGDIILLLMMMK